MEAPLPDGLHRLDPLTITIASFPISDLVSHLQSCFRPVDFAAADCLLKDHARRTQEQLSLLQDELRRLSAKDEASAEAIARLQEENALLSRRERRATEKFRALCEERRSPNPEPLAAVIEDLRKALRETVQAKERVDAELRNCAARLAELEQAKANSEAELRLSVERYEELSNRVAVMEEETAMLMAQGKQENNFLLDVQPLKTIVDGRVPVAENGPLQDLVMIDCTDKDSAFNSGDVQTNDSGWRQLTLVTPMMNRGNRKWNSEVDLLIALRKDPQLSMEAICALYRQHMEKSSRHLGFDELDAPRGMSLAKFLIAGDPHGKLKRSVTDLKKYDADGLKDCKQLAMQYSRQLFDIYTNKLDTLFCSL